MQDLNNLIKGTIHNGKTNLIDLKKLKWDRHCYILVKDDKYHLCRGWKNRKSIEIGHVQGEKIKKTYCHGSLTTKLGKIYYNEKSKDLVHSQDFKEVLLISLNTFSGFRITIINDLIESKKTYSKPNRVIKKSYIMKVKSKFYNNIASEDPFIEYYVYCLPGQKTIAKALLNKTIEDRINVLEKGLLSLKASFKNIDKRLINK